METEKKQMMETLMHRERLLGTGTRAAEILLSVQDDGNIEAALMDSMEIVGQAVDADRLQIWRNEMTDGSLHFVNTYRWYSHAGQQKNPAPIGLKFPYSGTPTWESLFLSGGYINGPVSELSEDDRAFLGAYDLKALAVIPMFLQGNFWGIFTIADCKRERTFTEDEIKILRSVSLMMASAVDRHMKAIEEKNSLVNLVKILGGLDAMICVTDPDTDEVLFINDKMKQVFGVESDYVGQTCYKILRNLDERCDFCPCNKLREYPDEEIIWEEHNLITNRIYRNISRYIIWTDGKTVHLQHSLDITDLRTMLTKLDLVVKSANIGLWDMTVVKDDPLNEKNIFTWSDEFRHMLGFSDENDFPNLLGSFTDRLHPEDKDRTNRSFEKHLFDRTGATSYDAEFRAIKKNGECAYFRAFGETIRDANGEPLYVAGALMDVTETKNTLIETQRLREEAVIASNAKSSFLASMSHEMRTPLNAVIGLSELSLENDGLDEDTRSHIEKIHNAGTTLLNTVNDILDISKIESGKLELVPVEYDVSSVINDAVTLNIMRIGDKPIKFELNVSADVFARLYGDELRVKQIMNNLLSNAIKYTDAGIVELSAHCVREDDTVWFVVKVRDTGRGIRAEDMPILFDDYAQLDLKSNRRIEGTGLGLPITKRLVEMMDGSISVESEYGKGTVFTVRIRQKFVTDVIIGPEVVASLKAFRYSDGRRDRNAKFKRANMSYAQVLIVDDNPTNLDVAKGLMKPYKMRINCVQSGQEAISVIRAAETKYDAVFMDHMMPGMDGIEAARRIREIGTDYAKNMPIIALTANAIIGNEEMFLSKGFQAFLTKPIDISRLDAVLRQWVRDKEKESLCEDDFSSKKAIEGEKTPSLLLGKEIDGVDIIKGLNEFGGDEEVYLNILRSYTTSTRALLESIETVNEDKLADYVITVHGIKGTSWGIFANSLGEFAADLEKAGKAGDFSYIDEHNPAFLKAAWKIIYDLEDMLSAINAENPKPKKDKPDGATLSALLAACDAYDMDAADAVMAEIEIYQYEADDGLVDWLRENVDLMNVKEIVEKLSGFPVNLGGHIDGQHP